MQDNKDNNEFEFVEVEEQKLKAENLEALLKDDFGWIQSMGVVEVEGVKMVMGLDNKPMIVETNLTEEEFVSQWLDSFSLGYIGKKCYIDLQAWSNISGEHLRGVSISDKNGKILFLIPPLVKPKLTSEEYRLLEQAHAYFTNAASADESGDPSRAKQLIQQASNALITLISDDHVKFSDLIPEWFFEKYNVIPYVRQSMIYCRDIYGLNPENKEDWEFAEKIFKDIHNKRPISSEQKLFMSILSQEEFKFPEYVVVADTTQQETDSEDFDPFDS